MNHILTALFFLLTTLAFSQRDSLWADSVRSHAAVFFEDVDSIVICELKPYCYDRTYPTGLFKRPKTRTYCSEHTVMRHRQGEMYEFFTIDYSHVGSRYTLDKSQHDTLFQMIYHVPLDPSRGACYNPRHGIMLINREKGLIGFLEYCFECHQVYRMGDTPNIGPSTNPYFRKLEHQFFRKELFVDK